MAQSKHTGRPSALLAQSGLVAAFLAGTGAGMVAQTAHADGVVRCWGYNVDGQCNTPTDLGPCSSIAGGAGHTIAVRSDGSVRCWGYNNYGQCNTPTDLGPCSSVAGGGFHTIAVRSDGSVRCWGYNGQGQCDTPTDLGPCSSVAGGYNHTIALRSDGGVRCWGRNGQGQCNTPTDLGPCSSVAGGQYHTIALRIDGGVRCWGDNVNGQCNTPTDLGPCSGIASGLYHTIALRGNGGVRCWGQTHYGQCNTPADLGSCSSVAGGGIHTIAIVGPPPIDTDGDGWPESIDNCPAIANPLQADCNNNGVGDVCEIAAGAPDFNQDAIPDTCQSCTEDILADGVIDGADLGAMLSYWGPRTSAPFSVASDLNNDGIINGGDLGSLLSAWGPCVTVPSWATIVEAIPDPAVVTDSTLRLAITVSGMAWRVRDTATQMEMLFVPAGTFAMGCSPSDGSCSSDENPTHSVTLTQSFYMGRYEVTQSQWVAKMGSNPSYFAGQSDSASRPVEQVSWDTIQGYLSATGMRLPSEAEWEYACRAGTTTAFNFDYGSSDSNTVETIAWYYLNSGSRTHAVGGKAANALGLHDMSGNVWEWVNDWFDGSYYSVSPSTNPLGPLSGSVRVFRGGSWDVGPQLLRSSYRIIPSGWPGRTIGFRVARNP